MAMTVANPSPPGAPPEPALPSRVSSREQWIAPLLFIFSVACYASTVLNGFVYDDELQILANPYVKSWHYVPQIFRTTVWSFIGGAGESNYYRPMMTFTYLLLWKTFGDLPFGYHLVNILLNALVVVAVYLAGKQLLKSVPAAAAAAALFAIHPIHTEPVDWIACIPELEATLFFLCAFLLYIRRPRLDWKDQLGIAALYLAAMMAKEPAVLLAPLLVIYEHFVGDERKEWSFGQKVRHYLPVCLTGAGYLVLRRLLFGNLAMVLQHPDIRLQNGVFSGFALIRSYARLLFWPTRLSAFHTFHPSENLSAPGVLSGIAMVAACLLALLLTYRAVPQVAFCLLWIGLTLAPVLNVRWMAANVLTERYLYLPSVAFCWLVGWLGATLWDAWPDQPKLSAVWRGLLTLGALAIVAHSASVILQRNREWRDDLTLYLTTLKTDPDAYVMHLNLGTTYFGMHDFRAAERELKIALQLRPGSPNVLNALGCVYLEQGHLAQAADVLQQAIAAKPLWTDPHFNYGRVLKTEGFDNAALAEFLVAVETGPLNASARLFLGQQYAELGHYADAEEQLKESVQLLPTLVGQQALADLYLKMSRDPEAKALLQQMAQEYAFDGPTHLKLGRLLEKDGNAEEALKQYRLTLDLDPNNGEARAAVARLKNP
jgi:tetratricopeptide (TPR) repeat protein